MPCNQHWDCRRCREESEHRADAANASKHSYVTDAARWRFILRGDNIKPFANLLRLYADGKGSRDELTAWVDRLMAAERVK